MPPYGSIRWRLDLSHPDVFCDVARTGRMEVIDGWDPRYYERTVEADGSVSFRQRPRDHNAGNAAFFVPVTAGDGVLGVIATGSTQATGQLVLREIERMRPFLDQVGMTLSILSDIAERKRAEEALRRAVERLHTLVDTSRAVASTLDLDVLLDRLIRGLAETVPGTEMGAIYSSGRAASTRPCLC